MEKKKVEIVKKIDQFILTKMKERNIPGICLGISKDGETFYSRGYGFRDIVNFLPMTPDTLYGIGSTSKSFTSLAIMKLVEERTIKLDDPVSKYLDFQLGKEDQPILIHHLLSHSSGVQELNYCLIPFSWTRGEIEKIFPISNDEDFLSLLNSAKDAIKFAPNEVFMYNNDFYACLSLIVEKVTDMSFEEYIDQIIFQKSGMVRSTYDKQKFLGDSLNNRMKGYALDPKVGKIIEVSFPFAKTVHGAGGILSTANEMLKYANIFLNKGIINGNQVIPAKSIEKLFTPVISTPYGEGKNPQYCYGWIREDDFLGGTLIHHGGNVEASSNGLMLMPNKNLAVVVGQNMDNELSAKLCRGIMAILNDVPVEDVLPEIPLKQKLGAILGEYCDQSGLSKAKITLEGPILFFTLNTCGDPELKVPIIIENLEKLIFKIASPFEIRQKVHIFHDEESRGMFLKFDRQILFKK